MVDSVKNTSRQAKRRTTERNVKHGNVLGQTLLDSRSLYKIIYILKQKPTLHIDVSDFLYLFRNLPQK